MNLITKQPSKNKTTDSQNFRLYLENLEPRMMLSTVEIFASGSEGGEQLQLLIDGNVAETFQISAGSNILNDQTFFYETPDTITADDVRIAFLNDSFNANTGFDSNLVVDAIEVDGVRFETESATTFSTGTFLPEDGVQPGFRQSETLHANGFFQYSDCLLYTSPSPRDLSTSRMPSSA